MTTRLMLGYGLLALLLAAGFAALWFGIVRERMAQRRRRMRGERERVARRNSHASPTFKVGRAYKARPAFELD